jgi:hypothetical protein
MNLLKRFVKAITGSKKATTAVATFLFGMLAPVARRYGIDISPGDVDLAIKIGMVYVVGQGLADNGKEAKKLELAASKQVSEKTEAKPKEPEPTKIEG